MTTLEQTPTALTHIAGAPLVEARTEAHRLTTDPDDLDPLTGRTVYDWSADRAFDDPTLPKVR